MNDVISADGSVLQEHQNLTLLTHVMYGLHTLSWFSAGIFSVIAIILNVIKKPDLPNDFFRSHFRWQARSFWFTLLWLVLALPLWIIVIPGWIAYTLIGLWYLYRFIRGWWNFAERKSMPVSAA